MKLYVWNDPYAVSYGGSILYVVAASEAAAKKLAATANTMNYGSYERAGNDLPRELGEPDRILSLPCAEIYHWSE